ncbi:ATP synthase F1 subunit gamma [Proteocatella sphenisci]|uniref:ATP synthase F1 subunit gamma n=1 Tax=Proteocatella sphenisci TaxID=181070 RepID=UPI00048CE6FB|nr:ATP synthase F1 subunit gamma [Proteocatella sphenisci]
MAGAGMKDIKRRIKSVESTMQITKAMELVSSSKLRRAKEKVEKSRPYFNILQETIQKILDNTKSLKSAYTQEREVKHSLYIVIAGDRGLAGGYNANIIKASLAEMEGKNPKIIPIGRKASEYFGKRGYDVAEDYLNVAESLDFIDAALITSLADELYRKGQVDEVYVCYTEFVSALTQTPKIMKLLPLQLQANPADIISSLEFEPSPEEVFDKIIPRYLEGIVYSTIVDAFASEQGARRTAMESASDNASDMIDSLSLLYNRARQASITQEITEIVGGAEAIK